MKQLTFEIPEELTALEGVVVMICADNEGKEITHMQPWGPTSDHAAIGILVIALDSLRGTASEGWEEEV